LKSLGIDIARRASVAVERGESVECHSISETKSDRGDAHVLAELVCLDRRITAIPRVIQTLSKR